MGYYKIKNALLWYFFNTSIYQKKFLAGFVAEIMFHGYFVLQDNGTNPFLPPVILRGGQRQGKEEKAQRNARKETCSSVKPGRGEIMKGFTMQLKEPGFYKQPQTSAPDPHLL